MQLRELDTVHGPAPLPAEGRELGLWVRRKEKSWGDALFESLRVSFPALEEEEMALVPWSACPLSSDASRYLAASGGKFCKARKSVVVETCSGVVSRQKLNPWCWELGKTGFLFFSRPVWLAGYRTMCKVYFLIVLKNIFRPMFCTWQHFFLF